MSHHWADLTTARERAARDDFAQRAALTWRRLLERPELPTRFRFADGVWIERQGPRWVVRWAELSLRPLARVVLASAPTDQVSFGLPAMGGEAARQQVLQIHGVDLAASEVRVGVTRGHLLSIMVSIPLDVSGESDLLERAVECLCEHALGEEMLDRWIVTIDVVRSARRSRLSVLPTGAPAVAETHPLSLLEELVRRGVAAVTAELPESQLTAGDGDWIALDLEADPHGIQGDRLHAFTRCPEALKAALEGLPFDSARFTRGREVMVWFAWTQPSLATRLSARQAAEAVIDEIASTEGTCSVCGSGFGPVRDYLDAWVIPELGVLSRIHERLVRSLGTAVELGFYDTEWAREHCWRQGSSE